MAIALYCMEPVVTRHPVAVGLIPEPKETILLDDAAEHSYRDIAWLMINQHGIDSDEVEDHLVALYSVMWSEKVAHMVAEQIVDSVRDKPRIVEKDGLHAHIWPKSTT